MEKTMSNPELTRQNLYQYLIDTQAHINAALEEVGGDGPDTKSLRGQWAIAQKIIEHYGLGPDSGDLH
jgi:hypothetical protein